eukprot:TRINITY_DN2010_c0_g1_i2.p2 TRINITY_DN2010_c0_g1~~TRINITY_DN2010_c0_g1_i2.p2  ORF type:complete len:224 (+),score=53.25 TRINITY_DN2010_c0_g1_i2:26-673(+)
MTISGLFEIHITTHRANDVEAFRAACAALALKPVLIQLPAGEHATQLMTSSYVSGSLDKAAAQARQQADALQAAGFPASRVKVEAMISNAGVPDTAADAQASIAESAGRYFEFHLKIAMRPGDYDAVNAVCHEHGARLARNAFKQHTDTEVVFISTLRVGSLSGRQAALAALEALRKALTEAGSGKWEVLSAEREYVVMDSNIGLDRGWIDSVAA